MCHVSMAGATLAPQGRDLIHAWTWVASKDGLVRYDVHFYTPTSESPLEYATITTADALGSVQALGGDGDAWLIDDQHVDLRFKLAKPGHVLVKKGRSYVTSLDLRWSVAPREPIKVALEFVMAPPP